MSRFASSLLWKVCDVRAVFDCYNPQDFKRVLSLCLRNDGLNVFGRDDANP
jgi:hypothetical protein